MLKAWRSWRNNTTLSDGTFLKLYIWTSVLGGK
jgi:hypothetical protein